MSHTTPLESPVTVDACKARIQALYEQHPAVRLNIVLTHTKVVQDTRATIVGVYKHCFCVEECTPGTPQRHTFTYADLLTHRVDVLPDE